MSATKLLPVQDHEWATEPNRWGLKGCGLWRDEGYSRIRNVISSLTLPAYVLFISVFGVIPQTLALVRVWGVIPLMVENLITNLPFIVALCKIVTLWFKKEVIITMMNVIRDDWKKRRNEVERKIMIKYAQFSRILAFGGYLVIGLNVCIYYPPVIFGVILRTQTNLTDTGYRPVVLQAFYYVDVYQTPVYQLINLSHTVSSSIAGFCYTTVGGLVGATVLHVCSQLESLKIRLESMKKNDPESRKTFQEVLELNVLEHQRLIRFVDLIENSFSIMLLMIVPCFTITFCFQGFQLVSALGDDVDPSIIQIGFDILYMTFVAFVMFVYSLVGEILVTQSSEIQHAVYKCEWYNLKPREAAQLIILLIRAQRPLTITAGKFVSLSLSTFATLLKTTAGYLSCLLAVQE